MAAITLVGLLAGRAGVWGLLSLVRKSPLFRSYLQAREILGKFCHGKLFAVLLLQFTITGRWLPWVHMPQINGAYSPWSGTPKS